jgi:FkbM family methyltransferase
MTIRRAILACAGTLLLINSVLYFPILRVGAASLTGRNACTLGQTIDGIRYVRSRERVANALATGSRIVQRGPGDLVLWDTPKGPYWIPARSNPYVLVELSEQENNLYGTGEWAVHPGDIVLDCGANIGVFTQKALLAGARLVVAIELAPDNIEALRRTFDKEIAEGRVIVYPKGVWNKDDFLVLDSSGSSLDDSVVFHHGDNSGPKVPLTTIDKIVPELGLPRVDFIKMDIEGAERQALDGARGTIAAYKPRLAIATEHIRDDPEQIPVLVHSLWSGYQMQCGPCYGLHGRVAPDVEYFR